MPVSVSSSESTNTDTKEPSLPSTQTINLTTNDTVNLKILELLQELKDDMQSCKRSPPTNTGGINKNSNNGGKKKKRRCTKISKYC